MCPNQRQHRAGCAACLNRVPITGFNTIRDTHSEWVEFLSNPADADLYFAGTHRKLAFRCAGTIEHPHPEFEYTQMGSNRVRGRGCPKCGNRLSQVRHGVIRETHPEWPPVMNVPRKADVLSAGTSDRVRFWCEGTSSDPHERCEYEQYGYNRRKGSGCPVCAGKEVPIYPLLRDARPDLVARLADPTDAGAQVIGKRQSFLWVCIGTDEQPHARVEFRAQLSRFTAGLTRCPACRGRVALSGFNTIRDLRPDLAVFLVNPADADTHTLRSRRKLLWWCEGTAEAPHPRSEHLIEANWRVKSKFACADCHWPTRRSEPF